MKPQIIKNIKYIDCARYNLFSPIFTEDETRKISDLTGRQVESWEVAYFNGAAILDEIPVSNRDQTDQVVFREGNTTGSSTAKVRKQINSIETRLSMMEE